MISTKIAIINCFRKITGYDPNVIITANGLYYSVDDYGLNNTLWSVPPQRLITYRKQPHRKTGITKARREAKKRRNRK